MAQDKVSMPASTAGLTRYFDDVRSKIEISPGVVVVLCVLVIIAAVLLHMFAAIPTA
ncbi:preprotein translocase subunit Sec61beta [Candidatus Woesearchaeota archaeon]|jgi:preprotein translocase subunit Sec61beta|nr:preprotein translocase subunit Sec61beta [Candidatus Woesearchaeota archaeon]